LRLREEVFWWLRAARRDLERAERSLSWDDRAAAFWAQQAAEKALKAVLLAFKGGFPRTHSIRRLFEELGSGLGLGEEELWSAYELAQFYSLSRCPDIVEGLPDEAISRGTAERAVRAARRVVEAAERAVEEASREGEGVG